MGIEPESLTEQSMPSSCFKEHEAHKQCSDIHAGKVVIHIK